MLLPVLAMQPEWRECGYDINFRDIDPDDLDIEFYEMDNMTDLAEQFVDEGLFGDIPEKLQFYLAYDKIARDLSFDYSETVIDDTNYIFRCF